MKVILVNGSPHEKGCTYTALAEVAGILAEEGLAAQIFQLGSDAISGCTDCGACFTLGRCVIDDKVNEFLALAKEADGFVFGSPVYYASANGALTSFMDRVFFAGSDAFYLKPAAAVISARRAGTTATFDQLNKYFAISQMPIISSQYWNMVHGMDAPDTAQDGEGLQTMRVLARNMAWLLKSIQAGRDAGVPLPKKEPRIATNFVR